MDRKWPFPLETALIAVLQIFTLSCALVGLLGVRAQSAEAEQPRKFEDFLNQFETNEVTTKLPYHYASLRMALSGYRSIKTRNAGSITLQADEAFRSQCAAWNGRIDIIPDSRQMMKDYWKFRDGRNPDPLFAYKPFICFDQSGNPLAALITSKTVPLKNGDAWATIMLFNAQGTNDMLTAYRDGKIQRAKEAADAEQDRIRQIAKLEQQRAKAKQQATLWRKGLTIGDETHCGYIIEIRGPMIQIASGSRSAWVRREQVFPVDGKRDCTLY